MRCVLGFDGGGTKTDCVLMDETAAILARTRSGPSNPIIVGIDGATAALLEAAEKALVMAGTSLADVKIVGGGVAGAGATRDLSQIIARLQAKFVNAHISILSDLSMAPVSYTHLDVYKRQEQGQNGGAVKDPAGENEQVRQFFEGAGKRHQSG